MSFVLLLLYIAIALWIYAVLSLRFWIAKLLSPRFVTAASGRMDKRMKRMRVVLIGASLMILFCLLLIVYLSLNNNN